MNADLKEEIVAPDGVTVTQDGHTLTVKGEKGELQRRYQSKKITMTTKNNTVTLEAKGATQREKKLLYTFRAHLKNMFAGVTQGHEYKLKICSGHFPMNVGVKGDQFEIKNFLGESVPRLLKLKTGADVKIDGDLITITGIEKEIVSQVAGDIEKMTRRPGFDNRIFQDGIYIIEKDGKQL